jgi:cytochrome P450
MAFNAFGPRNAYFEAAMRDAEPVLAWLQAQTRRDALAPGGFGAAVYERADAGQLTQEEAGLVVRSILTAGVDTTVSGIGAAAYCLARFPDQFCKLRDNPNLARGSFEEAVRFESPVQTFFRTTTRSAELGGVSIEEGEKVLMFLGAANRDARRWERPDEYDIERRNAGHVGFGYGIHQCVGQILARLEGDCVLNALARKAASIEVSGPIERRFNNTMRGLAHLPVMMRAA